MAGMVGSAARRHMGTGQRAGGAVVQLQRAGRGVCRLQPARLGGCRGAPTSASRPPARCGSYQSGPSPPSKGELVCSAGASECGR